MTLAARMAALACELEVTPGHGGHYDGIMHAVDRIREELAAEDNGQQSVWVVAHDDYEDQRIETVFTTEDLARQHRDQLQAEHRSCDVTEYDVLDHLPQRVQYVAMKAIVHPSGMVETVPSNAGKQQAVWDYKASGYFHSYQATDGRTCIDVSGVDPGPLLRAKAAEVIAGFAAEQGWSESKLEWTLGREWVTRRPQVVEQQCYDASFGRVHVRSSCRCPR
jgi:hypothetical protein